MCAERSLKFILHFSEHKAIHHKNIKEGDLNVAQSCCAHEYELLLQKQSFFSSDDNRTMTG
jgi:hypothetical protein